MKIVLLPGLDGTGLLSQPFLKEVPLTCDVLVVPLNQKSGLDVAAQAEYIESILPQGPFLLIAESYSGRVAYELIRRAENRDIVHVVFVASFLRNPSPVSFLARHIPKYFLRQKFLTKHIASRLAFGADTNPAISERFSDSLSSVPVEVLKTRIREVSEMKPPTTKIMIPSTYIQAASDYLVSRKSLMDFEVLCEQFESTRIAGTHFLMQTNPCGVWEIIENIGDVQTR